MIAQRDSLQELGIPKENVLITANGDKLVLLNGEIKLSEERIEIEDVYIDDNSNSTKASGLMLKNRKVLSEEGVLSIVISIDPVTNKMIANPLVISRGTFYTKESMDIVMRLSRRVRHLVEEELAKPKPAMPELKAMIKKRDEIMKKYDVSKKLAQANVNASAPVKSRR
ncbi:unnamed protein product [Didymodactylos carnosus]|uniref:Ribonuclease J C-terminal domain-containing protein n=1 Tax=Didymodactylos carnosus TaxID=1234261 RepID=A0A8S2ECQ6_9BILA|nr:unnamed protein product [Didymodactylos carnosus]CAF4001932.1 unnamed protein product [Didymodactylos carnosus]